MYDIFIKPTYLLKQNCALTRNNCGKTINAEEN